MLTTADARSRLYRSSDEAILDRLLGPDEYPLAPVGERRTVAPNGIPQMYAVEDHFLPGAALGAFQQLFHHWASSYEADHIFTIASKSGNNLSVMWGMGAEFDFVYHKDGHISLGTWRRNTSDDFDPYYQVILDSRRYRNAFRVLLQQAVSRLVTASPGIGRKLLARSGGNVFSTFFLQYFLKYADVPAGPLKRQLKAAYRGDIDKIGTKPRGGGLWHHDVSVNDPTHIVQGTVYVSVPRTMVGGNTIFRPLPARKKRPDGEIVREVIARENRAALFDGRRSWHRVLDFCTHDSRTRDVSRDLVGISIEKTWDNVDRKNYSELQPRDTRRFFPAGHRGGCP